MSSQTVNPSPPPQPSYPIPVNHVALWTLAWLVPMLLLLTARVLDWKITYDTFTTARSIGVGVLVVLAIAGVLTAWRYVGNNPAVRLLGASAPPWYTNAFLVALVLFWALFPPIWFFAEYFLLDIGGIVLPEGLTCKNETPDTPWEKKLCTEEIEKEFLAQSKTYADLAAKVWGGVAASLAGAIALARK